MEGSGKSEKAKQDALILNHNFKETDVIYTTDQFEEWVAQSKPGQVCLWDEFVLAGLSTDALSEMQKTLIKQFTMMRSKQLIVILVIPYIFMLRKYFAVARTRFLVHTYAIGLNRGYCRFYPYNSKHYLYNYGQKTWLYNTKVLPAFQCRYKDWSGKLLDESIIEQRKQDALESITEKQKEKKITKREVQLFQENRDVIKKTIPIDNVADYTTMRRFLDKIGKLQVE